MGARSSVGGGLSPEDRGLLDGLVRELGPRLLAYIRRAWRAHDAEDILAETFCRAAANMATLRRTERPDLYVLTIARNLCRDARRRQRPTAVPDEILRDRADGMPEPDRLAAGAEQIAAVREAVTALPEPLREIVVLRLSGGLKFEEIADLLKIPLGTALSRMHTALEQLREVLAASPARRVARAGG